MLSHVNESFATTEDGVRLWTVRSGEGAPRVVLCHGGPGSWDQMDSVAEMLDDVAQVVRWDQRGCGRSAGDGPYRCDRFLADLDVVRRHWGIDSWIVGGHSAGASLALLSALDHAETTEAVVYLSGTGLQWERDSVTYHQNREMRLGDHLERWTALRQLASPTADERRELMLLTSSTDFGDTADTLALAEAWLDERFEPNMECNRALGKDMNERLIWATTRLDSLACPVLVIHGVRDPRPLSAVAELASAVPNGRLVTLEGVGHLPWAQRPGDFRAALRDFVTAKQSRGAG